MHSQRDASEPLLTVLVIDDEPQIRRVVRNALTNETTRVIEAATGDAGVDGAASEQPNVIVLDLGLPDRDGIDVCRDLRAFTIVPIIVLSARHREGEKVALLDAGADDYMTKPFSTAELQARVRALLRRTSGTSNDALHSVVAVGDLTIDLTRRSLTKSGAAVHLTPTEWDLLRALVRHAGKTLTHQQLFQSVWGNQSGDAQQYLRVYVGQLRRKIESDVLRPKYIRTEPSIGYRFDAGS